MNNNSEAKTTLKDSAILTISMSNLSDQQSKSRVFPESDKYKWEFSYYPAQNALSYETEKNHVKLTVNFVPAVGGRVTIEAEGLPMKTSGFPKCQRFYMFYVHHNDFFAAINNGLALNCKVEIDVEQSSITGMHLKKPIMGGQQYPIKLYEFNDLHIPTDFEVHCGDDHYKVHKEGLIQLSPVFEAMIEHNDTESSSNMIEINDFDFKTVETALNCCYWRACGGISVETAINVLRFAEKYIITDNFSPIEEMLERNLSATNFFTVLHCANDCDKPDLFTKCAKFYKNNEDTIKTTETFLALPRPLLINLLKSAFNFEVEFDVFLHARKNGIHLDMEEMQVTTFADFFRIVPYAWHYYEDTLKFKCTKFWVENKDILEQRQEFQLYPRAIKDSLKALGYSFGLNNL